jgi:ferrous iron transport protein B
MARAAFLMDELMLRVGLNGRAFHPAAVQSFACAIPGIMAARTIEEERDRLTTIMVAPLMTCSARLPVYTLLIGVFIPADHGRPVQPAGPRPVRALCAGVDQRRRVAFMLKRTATKGPSQPLIMELPTYKLPVWRDFFLGLVSKAWAFLKRAGTIIFGTTVALWVLAYFPNGGTGLEGSYAGMIGRVIEPIFQPIGFNLEMVVALIPGMAAREAAVSSLGLIYSLGPVDENEPGPYRPRSARRLDPADGSQLHRLVRLRAAVFCDARHRAPRDQLVEMDGLHVRLPDRTGVRRRHGSPSGSRPGPGCRRFSGLKYRACDGLLVL